MMRLLIVFILGIAAALSALPCADLDCDKAAVRAILDSNGQQKIPVELVIGVYDSQVVYVRFPAKTITHIPEDISRLAHLTILDARDNNLTGLPSIIGFLKELHTLNVSNNKIVSLPSTLGSLKKLEYLKLEKNKLTSLPVEIGDLAKLSMLTLDSNKLTGLPSEIGNLAALRYLHISDNLLKSLPSTITKLTLAVDKPLAGLHVQGNCLSSVSTSISNWINTYNRSFVRNKAGVYDNLWKGLQYCGSQSARVPAYLGSGCALP